MSLITFLWAVLFERFSSLAPPNCSAALVSEWFNQLTAINQQIGTCTLYLNKIIKKYFQSFWGLKCCNEFFSCLFSDSLQNDFLLQLRCCCQQRWEQRLTEAESCKVGLGSGHWLHIIVLCLLMTYSLSRIQRWLQVALSDLQLSDVEVEDVVNSQLLPLIGQVQRQDEERLAALDVCQTNTTSSAFMLYYNVSLH